jgi:peptidoglycan/LPS O-acetylase OafA/YrhL/O-antigen/teichoic acid export membrane protein/SAM-dependent methyltransferase
VAYGGLPARASRRTRIDALDGIRGLAIALVVAFHAGLAPGGGIGVTIFFVLSGYLITEILLRPSTLSRSGLARFWARRLLRLFPALAVVCLFCTVWALLVVHGHSRHLLFAEILASLTYTQDFYLGHGHSTADFGYLGQTWSLGVEQQFYLLWPFLLMAITRVTSTWRGRVAVTLVCALTISAWRAYLAGRGLNAQVGLNIDAQGDSLLVGCALALAMPHVAATLTRRQRLLDVGAISALVLIVAFGAYDLNGLTPGRVGYLVIALSTAVLILRLLTEPTSDTGRVLRRAFSWRPVVWLGAISYSVYLWHPVIFKIALDDVGLRSWPQKIESAPILGSLILLVSWASYRWVEQPFQHLKDRRIPERAPSLAPAPEMTATEDVDKADRPAPRSLLGRLRRVNRAPAHLTAHAVISIRGFGESSLHRNSAWIMMTIVTTSGFGYAYWVAAAHLFAAPQVGLATALVSLMTVTAIVANFGTAPALVQRLPTRGNIEDWSTTLSASLLGSAGFGAAAAVIVLAGLGLFSHRLTVAQSDPALALLFVLGTSVWAVSLVLDYTFIAERRSRSMSVRGALFAIIKIPLVAAPVVAFGSSSGATTIFASWVVACAISCAVGVFVMVPALRSGFRLRRSGTVTEMRAMSRLLAGNYLITLGNSLPLYLLPVIVVSRLSATANAYFYITWMVGGLFFMISSSIGSSLFAEGSNHPGRLAAATRASVRLTILLLAPAMFFVFVAGKWILSIFGPAYAANGTHLLWILAVAAIPDAITNIYAPVLRVRDRLRAAGVMTMSMALWTIVAAWIVAPSLKLEGVGAVWLAGQALGSLWVAWDTGTIARLAHLGPVSGAGRVSETVGSPTDTMARTAEELREHFEIERELAAKLRSAVSREERRRLYSEVYRERSERISHHPLVRLADDPGARAASVIPQVRLLKPFLDLNRKFVEVGAGDGAVARAVAPHVKHAVALDVTDVLFRGENSDGLELRVFDGFELGVPDSSVDVVYSHDVVEHLHEEDMLEQTSSIRRALRDGGVYVCVTPNRLSGPHDISAHFTDTPEGFHLREYTVTELAGAFRAVGFRRIRVFVSKSGYHLTPRIPAHAVHGLEVGLQQLPANVRRSASRSLHSVKVVAVR